MLDITTVPSVPTFGGRGPLTGPEQTWYAVFEASKALGGRNVASARLATTVVLQTPCWDGLPEVEQRVAPPAAAIINGHDLAWDPPAAMTAARRWTCRRRDCGAAAIRYEANEYGTACEQTCDEVAAGHQVLRDRGLI